jgi:tetratricopeptide (TPR) repeat protein
MDPTRGIHWKQENSTNQAPTNQALTQTPNNSKGKGKPPKHQLFSLVTDDTDDLEGVVTFPSPKADILIYLCESEADTDTDTLRHVIGQHTEKRPIQLVGEILKTLEKMKGCQYPPYPKVKKIRADGKEYVPPRYGTWRVPVIEDEFILIRTRNLIRATSRNQMAARGEKESLPDHRAHPAPAQPIRITEEVLRAILEQCRTPHQLPAYPSGFVGRQKELRRLRALGSRQEILLVGLCGMGGIGKTALATVLAHEWKTRFPDAQLFIEVSNSAGGAQSPTQLMVNVIHALRPEAQLLISKADDKGKLEKRRAEIAQIYRDTLSSKRVLIVLDGVQKAEQVISLLPPSATCGLLFTSRQGFMFGDHLPYIVGRMDDKNAKEATKLLRRLSVPASLSDAEAKKLIELCAGLPLAIRIVGCHLGLQANERGGFADVASYIEKLEAGRLAALDQGAADAGEETVSASLKLSEAGLTAEQKKAWWRLAVFEGSFDRVAGGAVTEIEDSLLEALDTLVRRSLLECLGDRYRLHDVVRDFAQERLRKNGAQSHTAHLNHSAHYLDVLKESNRLFKEGGDFTEAALRLFDAEWPNIEAGQKWAQNNASKDNRAAQLCIDYPSAAHILKLRLHPRTLMGWQVVALEGFQRLASKDVADNEKEALLRHNLGLAHSDLGEWPHAITYFQSSLVLMQELENSFYEAVCRGNYGWVFHKSNRKEEALAQYKQALQAANKIEDARQQSEAKITILTNWGIAHKNAGEFDLALACYEDIMTEAKQLKNRRLEAELWGNVGVVCDLKGEHQRAITYFRKQHTMAKKLGYKRGQASALFNQALATYAVKDTAAAIRLAEAARDLFQLLDDPMTAEVEEQLKEWRAAQEGQEGEEMQ